MTVFRIALVTNTRPNTREILQWLLPELTQSDLSDESKFLKVQEFLIQEFNEGRRVLLVIDEAQNLSLEALEELRMLTNINLGKEEVLQLFLIGQPELRDHVRRRELVQFAQRVAANYHLPYMQPETVLHYISHRLKVAGGKPNVFSKQAAMLIHEVTGGVPRLINQLCDMSLTYAFAQSDQVVKRATVQSVSWTMALLAAAAGLNALTSPGIFPCWPKALPGRGRRPSAKNSIEILSGERTKAMRPSRGGRVDGDAIFHQVLASGVDIIHLIGQMPEVSAVRGQGVVAIPIPCQFYRAFGLARRGHEDQRKSPGLAVVAADLFQTK